MGGLLAGPCRLIIKLGMLPVRSNLSLRMDDCAGESALGSWWIRSLFITRRNAAWFDFQSRFNDSTKAQLGFGTEQRQANLKTKRIIFMGLNQEAKPTYCRSARRSRFPRVKTDKRCGAVAVQNQIFGALIGQIK